MIEYENKGSITMICGGLAGLVGTLVSMPCDVSRTRLIAQSVPKYKGLLDVWKQMFFNEGLTSLWKGLGPTLAMTIPFAAIQFRLYFLLSSFFPAIYQDDSESKTLGLTRSSVSGATAGVCAKMVVYPLDILKKRMQIRGTEDVRQKFGKVIVYKNSFDCIVKLTKQEGLLGWYKGLWPSLIKSGLFSALVFTFYELSCRNFDRVLDRNDDDR